MAVEIWVNPACSKCRAATAELDTAGVAYTVRRYLDEPPTTAELDQVLRRMGLEPWDVARPAETRELGIDLPKDAANRGAWLAALVANPRAIQRPIITLSDGSAVLARDTGTLDDVIEQEKG